MEEMITFVAGVALGALSSWFITHRYYVKASTDQTAALEKLSSQLKSRNTLQDFETLLVESAWDKEFIEGFEVWVCKSNNTFQIQRGERTRDFTERWTTMFPDRNSSAYPVFLKIGGTVVKELTFISMDGGRIFVPMADLRPSNGDVEYFWNVNSLEVKVCRIVGTYYIHKDLEGVAHVSQVMLVA